MALSDTFNIGIENTTMFFIGAACAVTIIAIILAFSRFSTLDLLRIASVLLFSVALAGTYISHQRETATELIFVLDTSESMSITDANNASARFDEQNYIISSILRSLRDNDKVTIITVGADAAIRVRRVPNANYNFELSEEDIYSKGNISSALDILLGGTFDEGQVILMSDGQTHDDTYNDLLDQLKERGVKISTIGIGSTEIHNSGIYTLSIPKKFLVGENHSIVILVQNSGPARNISAEFRVNGTVVDTKNISLTSEFVQRTFTFIPQYEGIFYCEIVLLNDTVDLIPQDNSVFFTISAKKKNVLLLDNSDDTEIYKQKVQTGWINFENYSVLEGEQKILSGEIDLMKYDAVIINPSRTLNAYLMLKNYTNIKDYLDTNYPTQDWTYKAWPMLTNITTPLEEQGYTIDFGSELPAAENISKYDLMLIALCDIKEEEIDTLYNWVEGGGALFVGYIHNEPTFGMYYDPYNSTLVPGTNVSWKTAGFDDLNITGHQKNIWNFLHNKTNLSAAQNMYCGDSVFEIIDSEYTKYMLRMYEDVATYEINFSTNYNASEFELRNVTVWPSLEVDGIEWNCWATVYNNSDEWTGILQFHNELLGYSLNITLKDTQKYYPHLYADGIEEHPMLSDYPSLPWWSTINVDHDPGSDYNRFEGRADEWYGAMIREVGSGRVMVMGPNQCDYAESNHGIEPTLWSPLFAPTDTSQWNTTFQEKIVEYVFYGGGLILMKGSPREGPLTSVAPGTPVDSIIVPYGNDTLRSYVADQYHPVTLGTNISLFGLRGYEQIQVRNTVLTETIVQLYDPINKYQPLVLSKRYGLGKIGMFASDPLNDPFVDTFIDWSDYGKFWRQFIDYVSSDATPTQTFGFSLDKTYYSLQDKVVITIYGPTVAAPICTITMPDNNTLNLSVKSQVSGLYKAEFSLLERGTYTINVTNSSMSIYTYISVAPTLLEFQNPLLNETRLREIAGRTEGEYYTKDTLSSLIEMIENNRPTEEDRRYLWPYFTIAACALLFVEWYLREKIM